VKSPDQSPAIRNRPTQQCLRAYVDEIAAHAAELEASDAQAAGEWADWIRQHAERTDPLNGPLRLVQVALMQSRRTPAPHGWLERPRAVPALAAVCSDGAA
jgi:hypothetical protein